ncbi:hypothetical protein BDQ17DRAFT_1367262, partial [Cyathus striatus]
RTDASLFSKCHTLLILCICGTHSTSPTCVLYRSTEHIEYVFQKRWVRCLSYRRRSTTSHLFITRDHGLDRRCTSRRRWVLLG